MEISAVINTHNEERNIARCLRSILPYVDEVIVVDMNSDDKTREIAHSFTQKIYLHPRLGYVEPARNFAIEKAKYPWIFILDADETISEKLGLQLRNLTNSSTVSFYRIARKNIIFGKWIRHCGWWPDYQVRFFNKGTVTWQDEIHSVPITTGTGLDLAADEHEAIIHYNYQTVSQFIERLNCYTTYEAKLLLENEHIFKWTNLLSKPAGEFISRFFALEGYKDGLYGLSLSLLQAFSVFVVQVKLWEGLQYSQNNTNNLLEDLMATLENIYRDVLYWYYLMKQEQVTSIVTKMYYKIRSKLRI